MKVNIEEMLKAVEKAEKSLNVNKLNVNNINLMKELTLGDDWDSPHALGKALDFQAYNFAQWSTLKNHVQAECKKEEDIFNVWVGKKRLKLREVIIQNKMNKNKATRKQAAQGITQQLVDDYFNREYYDTDLYNKRKKKVEILRKSLQTLEVIVNAYKHRKDMLTSMTNLLNRMIDKDLLVIKRKNK